MADESSGGILQMIRMMLDPASAQKTEKDMQDALNKGTDPKGVEGNTTRAGAALDFLKGKALALGAALAAAFAITKLIQFGRESIKQATEARNIWRQLDVTLTNAGQDAAALRGEIERTAVAFQRAGIMGDEEFATVLTKLVQISGDYGRSINNIGVVADLAAAKQIGLEEAALLVGRAMNGNVTALGRMGIEVKAGADAIAELDKRFRGAAEAQDPLIRQQKALSEAWGDLKEAIGDALVSGKAGQSLLQSLAKIVIAVTQVVKENESGFRLLGEVLTWLVRGPLILAVSLMSGLASTAALAAKGMILLDEAMIKSRNAFGASSPEIEAEVKRLKEFADRADAAAEAAHKLALAVAGQGPSPTGTPGTPPPPGGALGGAVTGAKGDKADTPEEQFAKEEQLRQARIQAATESLEFDDLRAEGLGQLIALQDELNKLLTDENLTFEQRVALTQDLKSVQEALIGGVKQLAAEYGITGKVIDQVLQLQGVGALKELAKEARGRAAWNIAKALEEYARAWGWIGLGNFPSAAAAKASAAGHMASAAKWAALAGGGAALTGGGAGGGNAGGANGDAGNLGGDASQEVKQPATEINIWIDGMDPQNTQHHGRFAEMERQVRERFGENSTITIMPGSGR